MTKKCRELLCEHCGRTWTERALTESAARSSASAHGLSSMPLIATAGLESTRPCGPPCISSMNLAPGAFLSHNSERHGERCEAFNGLIQDSTEGVRAAWVDRFLDRARARGGAGSGIREHGGACERGQSTQTLACWESLSSWVHIAAAGYRASGEIACESSNDKEVSRAAVRALRAY